MSPILLRPIREQFEHDRVIRQLQARWRRRFEAAINVGSDEEVAVKSGSRTLYPDLVLTSTTSGRRLHGVVEVETAESVNHLEAMAEWKHFAKIRGAFYLYVPAGFTDVAERLCADGRINVTEVWAYYAIASQVKFSMTYRSPRAKLAAKAAAKAPRPTTRVAKSKSKPKPKPKPKKPAAKRPNAKKPVVKKKAAKKKTVAKKTVAKKAAKKKAAKKKAAKKKAPARRKK